MRIKSFLLIFIFVLGGCVGGGGDEQVEVRTDGIFEPATVEIVGGTDLGEILIGDLPVVVPIIITNNSKFDITDIDVVINPDASARMSFETTEGGGEPLFPGSNGTCVSENNYAVILDPSELMSEAQLDAIKGKYIRRLAPGKSCIVNISYNPARAGVFTQDIKVKYRNLVDPVEMTYVFDVVSGEPASLIWVDDVSFYDYGVLEQTEPILKFQDMYIENRGGISARNVDVAMTANTSPAAFNVVSHNCPDQIEPGEGCRVTVSYIPLNNDEADPETDYNGNLTVSYIKDGKLSVSGLNAFYQFKSTKIQGNFETNLSVVTFSPDLIAGNRESRAIKIINKGYREGIVKELRFYNDSATHIATCTKGASTFLECVNPGDGLALTLNQFPFKVQEQLPCLDLEMQGVSPSYGGDSCFFSVTLAPSVQHITSKLYDNYTIELRYDSRWKGNESIIDESMFTLFGGTKGPGILEFDYVEFDRNVYPDLDPTAGLSFVDLGRLALILNPAYATALTIRVRNIGESELDMVDIFDGQESDGSGTAGHVSFIPSNIIDDDDSPVPGEPTYYRNVLTDCTTLAPNDFCQVNMDFVPMFYASEPDRNDMFLDVNPNDPPGMTRYKQFFFEYTDGTTYEDDETPRANRMIESRHTGVLVAKGYLVYQNTDPARGDLGPPFGAEQTIQHQIILENVGTGTIPYIKIDDVNNFRYGLTGGAVHNYPWEIVAAAPPAGVDHDCYDIIDFSGNYPPVAPGVLPSTESCSLTLEGKMEAWEVNEFFDADPWVEQEVESNVAVNGTAAMWTVQGASLDELTTFQWYDGDTLLGLPLPYEENFGFFGSLGNYQITGRFESKGIFSPADPTPIFSALLYRPQIDYPGFVEAPSGDTSNTGVTIPEWFYHSETGSMPGYTQILSEPHVSALVDNSYDYTMHAGTFHVGQTYSFSYGRKDSRGSRIHMQDIYKASGDPEIVMTNSWPVFPWYPTNPMTRTNFSFTPTSPGMYEAVINYEYEDNRFGFTTGSTIPSVTTRSIRVIAEAVDTSTAPILTVTEEAYDVTQVGSGTGATAAEAPSGIINPVDLRTNNFDGAYTDGYSAVKGSIIYAKKHYVISNPTGNDANGFSIQMKASLDAPTFSNNGGGIDVENSTCGTTLAAGSTCEFDVKFTATAGSSPSTNKYIHLHYEIVPNQYVYQAWRQNFTALNPAQLEVQSLNTLQVADGGGTIYSSYPVIFGGFLDPVHIYADAYPTVTLKGTYQINNLSTLKASFLKMVDDPGPVPGGDPVAIYDSGNIRVLANRACLYGDDELDGGVPADEKGFNSGSTATCLLTFEFTADETYLGGDIAIPDNIIALDFYNNKRASFDTMYFHMEGFIEPNHSTASSGFANVESDDTGEVYFEWGSMTPNNGAWGSINGYRIFYSPIQSVLDDIHTTAAPYVDVGAATTNATFMGLDRAKYYYFKVVARRSYGAVNYFSEDPALGLLEVIVPPTDVLYHDGLGVLIDKSYIDGEFGDRAGGVAQCMSKVYSISKNGAPTSINKQLITTPIWDFIMSDPDSVGYSTYSDYPMQPPPAIPHWLGDAATNIAPIFDPYGFDTTATSAYYPGPVLLYQKPCDHDGCNSLYKIVGGDGYSLPIGATYYTEANVGAGVYRCFAPK